MTLRVEWRARTSPLVASAVWVPRERAHGLLDRLPQFRGLATPAALVLLAPEAELPWVEHARYFGVDRAAPSLLLPTTRTPVPCPALVERAFQRALGGRGPWLVDDRERSVVSLERVGRIDASRVQSWLGGRA